ncbi:MAG: hypothetical protein L0Y62_02295 [Nitrospirae bacterium]|nr:hypothetical protein [Nitrospirota bacterium]
MSNIPEKNLYQLIVARLDGGDIHLRQYRQRIIDLVYKGIGGFIIFGGRRDEVRDFIAEIQSLSEIPLFIASDIERGVGQQIEGATKFPPQMAVAAAIDNSSHADVEILDEMINAIACEAKNVGINMALIPVMDVNLNPENPIICTRSFSDNPDTVTWFGSRYIRILEESGLISCAKHFPGHGDTSVDSHISLPTIKKTMEKLMEIDIKPFMHAIDANVSSIMIGHLVIEGVDIMPASISKKIITDLLRKELGYTGLILTDALNMKALSGTKDVYTRCLNAGADILLHPEDPDYAASALKSAIDCKLITEDRINEAIRCILNAKRKISTVSFDMPCFDRERHQMISDIVAAKSISIIKKKDECLPVTFNAAHLILAGNRELYKESPLLRNFKHISDIDVAAELTQEIILIALFTNIAAFKGMPELKDEEMKHIKRLLNKSRRSIIVSFGNPYVLSHFKKADLLVAAYDASENTQRIVFESLSGYREFTGKIPVSIDLH